MLLEGLAGSLTVPQREYLTTILAKADQLLQLITAMLDMSRLETSLPLLDAAPVALAEVIHSVVAAFLPQASKREIAVVAAIEQQLQPRGDRRQMHQVVWSLVSNAVKFTPRGGHVTVRLRSGAAPGAVASEGGWPQWAERSAAMRAVADSSAGHRRSRLYLESKLRRVPPTTSEPVLGRVLSDEDIVQIVKR